MRFGAKFAKRRESSAMRCNITRAQPWPFPSSLMIGCTAKARTFEITVDRTELEDARWFVRNEVALMLRREHPEGLVAPTPIAIAHHLLAHWAFST